MIGIETKLIGDLAANLDRFEAQIKESVLMSGVAAMALEVYNEVKLNTSGLMSSSSYGPLPKSSPHATYFYGQNEKYLLPARALYNAIYRVYSKEQSSDTVKTYKVSVNKKKAPHWAMVEYGTSHSAAHPYIRPAFDKINLAIEAGMVRMHERIGNLGAIEVSGTGGLPT